MLPSTMAQVVVVKVVSGYFLIRLQIVSIQSSIPTRFNKYITHLADVLNTFLYLNNVTAITGLNLSFNYF